MQNSSDAVKSLTILHATYQARSQSFLKGGSKIKGGAKCQ